ncbi:amidohydrolase [Enterobacteriaceae bacterium YMB-R22]|jgi:predicted TIM-barrel fold metal-dependent hydrolase|uniref:amidohydrolase family protein n=1 Tax=Tenebrionicola larvae TaxID=2815733 RepID=UPI002010D7AC|nr:amidohydrolase family protein [Tenebrionicola larvae]MBV4412467.1 amidohydrolase [Tenebrionicola larvae]
MDMKRIDVHQHVVPPFWADSLAAYGGDPSGWHCPPWSPEQALAFMDERGIAKGILSLTAPGIHGWPQAKRGDIAQRVNDYTARLVSDLPTRFGQFITLPLPDIDAALREIDRVCSVCQPEGVVFFSNYDNLYPGDARFEPLWQALSQRELVCFIHPTCPDVAMLEAIKGPIIDYPFDTTRAAVQLVANGVMRRYPSLKIILSHGGGYLPYAAHRFAQLLANMDYADVPDADSFIEDCQRFWFDTALSSSSTTLRTLLAFARSDRILYGSDFPYAPQPVIQTFTQMLDDSHELSPAWKASINWKNAQLLWQPDE